MYLPTRAMVTPLYRWSWAVVRDFQEVQVCLPFRIRVGEIVRVSRRSMSRSKGTKPWFSSNSGT